MKKLLLYLGRWQLSTPILAVVIYILGGSLPTIIVTIIANLIGGLLFYRIDRLIFRSKSKVPLWEIKDGTVCVDCGKIGEGYRIVEWRGYNRKVEANPQFRCSICKRHKMNRIGRSFK